MWGVVRLVFSEREGKRGMGWRRGMSQRHELVLCRRHQPARAQAVVPHHCPIFVGPTSRLRRVLRDNPQKEATVPALVARRDRQAGEHGPASMLPDAVVKVEVVVKQEDAVPKEVDPRGV